jgi:hypothetical protein
MKDKKVEIKKQPYLGIAKTFSLTINGIRYRLFRSTVTMMVITVAIAFMMNSLTESLLKRSMSRESKLQIRKTRLATTWTSRLSGTGSLEDILLFCASCDDEKSPEYEETIAFAKLDKKGMTKLVTDSKLAAKYVLWFNDLKYEDRRRLVHQAVSVGIFELLREKSSFETFAKNLKDMKSIRFADKEDREMVAFKKFLAAWPDLKAQAVIVRDARQKAIADLKELRKGEALAMAMTKADGDFLKHIESVGFRIRGEDAKLIAEQSREMQLQRLLEKRIVKMECRKEIARKYDVLPQDVNAVMMWDRLFSNTSKAEWTLRLIMSQHVLEKALVDDTLKQTIADKLALDVKKTTVKAGVTKAMKDDAFYSWLTTGEETKPLLADLSLDAATAVQMSDGRKRLELYIRAERLCADVREDYFMGLGKRMGWLLLVSLVVCIVGIANAMLMTVTERFREIATLKCLGALDGFIMSMFVIEATILGIVGGFFGSILGGLIGIGRMRLAFGNILWESFQPVDMVVACLLAIVMGVLMAAIAAVYPSFSASRMAPMEAMRID